MTEGQELTDEQIRNEIREAWNEPKYPYTFGHFLDRAVKRLQALKSPSSLEPLTDEEILAAFDGDFGTVEFDHKPTPDEIMLIKLKLVAQTQAKQTAQHYEAQIKRITIELAGINAEPDFQSMSDRLTKLIERMREGRNELHTRRMGNR